MDRLKKAIEERKSLEDRFFAVVVMVGLVIVTVSEIVTFVEGIGYIANIGTAIGGVMLLIVVFEAYVRKKIDMLSGRDDGPGRTLPVHDGHRSF